jgi:uncharacterized spore protein YtfJ
MEPAGIMDKVRDIVNVRAVIGEPIERDGVLVIPAAKIRGGLGGGRGHEGAEKEGSGGGFGVASTPMGVFVVKDGDVTWRPALDINKIILAGNVVAIAMLLTVRTIVKARRRRSS